jgi:hypothetical protein
VSALDLSDNPLGVLGAKTIARLLNPLVRHRQGQPTEHPAALAGAALRSMQQLGHSCRAPVWSCSNRLALPGPRTDPLPPASQLI